MSDLKPRYPNSAGMACIDSGLGDKLIAQIGSVDVFVSDRWLTVIWGMSGAEWACASRGRTDPQFTHVRIPEKDNLITMYLLLGEPT